MLKKLGLPAFLVAVALFCIQGGFYTYSVRQKIKADSLHVADSIRIADSTRHADSLMVERYASSDDTLSKQARRETQQARADDSARKAVIPITESEQDIFSSRSITISEQDANAGAIDSLQWAIDSLKVQLYEKDVNFQKMERFPFDEKKRYLHYLVENQFKDTAQVVLWCERMHAMLTLEQEKMHMMIKTQQDGNTKTFLLAHLKRTQDKIAQWSNLLVSLSASQEKALLKPTSDK
jgi:hypothetical protein